MESPRGELGFYIVSDGSNKPHRCSVRASSFVNLQALGRMSKGHLVADVIAMAKKLRDKHHIVIDPGYGKLRGKTFRLSNMGDETEETVSHFGASG